MYSSILLFVRANRPAARLLSSRTDHTINRPTGCRAGQWLWLKAVLKAVERIKKWEEQPRPLTSSPMTIPFQSKQAYRQIYAASSG
jgi:hypothetical protein